MVEPLRVSYPLDVWYWPLPSLTRTHLHKTSGWPAAILIVAGVALPKDRSALAFRSARTPSRRFQRPFYGLDEYLVMSARAGQEFVNEMQPFRNTDGRLAYLGDDRHHGLIIAMCGASATPCPGLVGATAAGSAHPGTVDS